MSTLPRYQAGEPVRRCRRLSVWTMLAALIMSLVAVRPASAAAGLAEACVSNLQQATFEVTGVQTMLPGRNRPVTGWARQTVSVTTVRCSRIVGKSYVKSRDLLVHDASASRPTIVYGLYIKGLGTVWVSPNTRTYRVPGLKCSTSFNSPPTRYVTIIAQGQSLSKSWRPTPVLGGLAPFGC